MLNKTFDLIAQFEGCRLSAYKCPAGVWTIGYGQTALWVKQDTTVTQQQADDLLRQAISKLHEDLLKIIKVELNESQWAAIISFVYNVGFYAFKKSTMLKMINAGNLAGATTQFIMWNKVNGTESKGLIKRRLKERQLFIS